MLAEPGWCAFILDEGREAGIGECDLELWPWGCAVIDDDDAVIGECDLEELVKVEEVDAEVDAEPFWTLLGIFNDGR